MYSFEGKCNRKTLKKRQNERRTKLSARIFYFVLILAPEIQNFFSKMIADKIQALLSFVKSTDIYDIAIYFCAGIQG